MKITTILLPTVEEQQEAKDDFVIDPAVTDLSGNVPASVIAFGEVVGTVDNLRVVDGRLVGDIEIPDSRAPFLFQPAGTFDDRGFRVLSVGLFPKFDPLP